MAGKWELEKAFDVTRCYIWQKYNQVTKDCKEYYTYFLSLLCANYIKDNQKYNNLVSDNRQNSEIDLLPILLHITKDQETIQMAPSSFMAEMRLSTEERLEKLRKFQQKFRPVSEINLNTFDVSPEIVIFQNFKPGTIYTTPLSLRNAHNVSRPLRGIFEPSPYFSVSYASEVVSTHIAPGMSLLFNIKFCAEDVKDYKYKIRFMTEGESFNVPIFAIGPRPLLDLPDHIILETTAVKVELEQSMLIRNLGQVSAIFTINTNAPFAVNPTKGILLPGRDMQLTIYFKSEKLGEFEDYLIVSYQSGEKLSIKIKGSSENSEICLAREFLQFHNTFMGLSRQSHVKLYNDSKHIAKFQWKFYSCPRVDREYGRRVKNCFHFMKEHEKIKDNKLEMFDITDGTAHAKIYDRIYEDEVEEFEAGDKFLYQNPNFQIIPLKGEVWPDGLINFTVIFSPTEVYPYRSNAYLEITGLEERLKLVLIGQGIGPHVELNLELLNANKIYMCAVHQYEVVAVNKGDIPAEIMYKETESDFGGEISCRPAEFRLDPYKCGAFTLQFSSTQQGKFFEEIQFEIKGSREILKFVLMGEIICPLLNFEISEIDFGVVPIGYPIHQPVVLRNHSMVPIEFIMSVCNDGEIPAITCDEFSSLPVKCGPYDNVREFDFSQRSGCVAPNSQLCVQLTLTANIIRECSTTLIAHLWGTDKHPIFLPVKYKACLPQIVCVPTEINIKFCFVTYPYKRTIVLYNDSQIPGFFQAFAETKSREGGITCTSTINEGFLNPYEEMEIELTITTTLLAEDKLAFFIKLFGDQPLRCCDITCVGQGPVVTTHPDKVDFGKVTLLEVVTSELTITNDSPISAFITTRLPPKSLFKIEPRTLELLPEESAILLISIYLCNPVKVQDKLQIIVENGTNAMCPLMAKGVGTSILCEPKIYPVINVGTLLTHQKFSFTVKFTNKGTRAHKMLWSRNKNLRQLKESPEAVIPSVFTFTPNAFDLVFEQSIEAEIEGFATEPGHVEEDYYCHAMIEKVKVQQIIISFTITAQFVDPVVEMSKTQMNFRKDVGHEQTIKFLVDEITITNKSLIPIQMDIYLKHPFYMHFSEDVKRVTFHYLELNHNQRQKIFVEFDTHTNNKNCFVVIEKLLLDYKNHPKIDKIDLTGEVNFPSIEIIPNFVKFCCLPTNVIDYHEITLRNVSPLPITYHFEWQEETLTIEEIEPTEITLPPHTIDSSFSRKSSDSGSYLRELELTKTKASEAEPEEDGETKKVMSSKETLINIEELDIDAEEKESTHFLPVECLYYRSCLEKNPSYHFTEIRDMMKPSLHMKDVLSLPQHSKEYGLTMRTLLYGSSAHFDEQETDADVVKSLPKKQIIRSCIDTVLNMAPVHGFLKPYECQLVSVGFHPLANMCVMAQAQCHVLGGATQILNITGMSSDLSYSIEEVFVEFGRRVFCELCEKSLTLTNTGHIEFEFLASAREVPNPVPSEFLLEAGCLTVTPKHGMLLPGSSTQLQIKYLPGIAGEFNEPFTIEIGYLPAITITVHGYGVFPQTYLYLPRPAFTALSPSVTYLAIAMLTPDYLRSLKDIKNIMHYNGDVYEEDISKVARQKLKKDDWVIISYNDLYPSIMDIDLAIERTILYQHILDNPTVLLDHTKRHRPLIVPNFTTPPYLVDFGYVILDTVVHYTVLIFNYGPINVNIRLVPVGGKKSPFEQAGLAIQFARSVIRVGDTKELFVIFHPTIEAFPELDYEICYPFYLDIGHGPRIPVTIKAVVTVPTITCEPMCLKFGEVCCGNCVKKSLLLYNRGHIISEWRAIIEKPKKKKSKRRYSIEDIRKKPVFFLKNSKGILEPGSGCVLDVYFEPQYDGQVEWMLIIYINQNPDEMVVSLKGIGLKPMLKISEEIVEFEPVLPYVHKCEKFFTIENVSSFPIEFYFSDFDLEIDEEERIINLLTQFYNVNELYVPPREAGQKIPQPLTDFYQKVLESLREKLIRIEKAKIEEEQNVISLGSLEGNLERRSSSKRKGITSKNKSQISNLRFATETELIDPLSTKTPEETEMLLKEHLEEYITETNLLESNRDTEQTIDPVNAAILESKGPPIEKDPTMLREGVFIIFHGGPSTNIVQAANKAGLEVGLPVYSIDRLFFESLAANSSLASIKINEQIDNAFKEVASEIDLVVEEGADEYDELQKKVDLLLSGKEKKPKPKSVKDSNKGKKEEEKSSKKDSKKSSEKDSKKEKKELSKKTSSKESIKEKKKKKDTRPTFMGLPENLLFEILKQRLSLFETGVVIESLYSIFIRQPILALNNVLKAIGNENLKQLEEKRILDERETLIQEILEMDGDQFINLTPEQFAIFREFALKQRKLSTIDKREALKRRLLDAKLGKKAVKCNLKDANKKKADEKAAAAKKSTATTKVSSAKSGKAEKESSKGSKKENKNGKAKLSPEEAEKKQDFNTFESDLQIMLHTLEYWDRKTSTPIKPLTALKGGKGSAGKKQSKSSKGSKPASGKKLGTPSKSSLVRVPIEQIPPTPEQEQKLKQTGIPCWLLNNAHKDKPVEALVANYLHHTPELMKATETLQESLKEKIEEVDELYTVLHKTKEIRERKVSNNFTLRDVELSRYLSIEYGKKSKENSYGSISTATPPDSKISVGSKTKKRRRSSGKRNSSKQSVVASVASPHRLSIDIVSQKGSIETEHIFTSRSVLSPGETLRYGITFKPEACGSYEHTFTIEMTGWPTKYHLMCRGKCDIPKIDMSPASLFAKSVYNRVQRNMYENNLFLKELNVFDFGPALVQDGEDIRLLATETEFVFTNCSLRPCETTFAIRDATEIYKHEPDTLTIQPNASEVLAMCAIPSLNENTDNQLIVSIKNNPKIETINLTSEACKFEFSLDPKLIHFDRVLVNQTAKKSFFFENQSLVPVNWEFIETENVLEHFKVSQLQGHLTPKSTQEIIFEYNPEITEEVPKQKMGIQVYDQNYKCSSPIHSDFIEISAEAIIVTIECLREIQIGEVKGRFEHTIPYTILNKGKYAAEFIFTPVTIDQDPLYGKHECIRSYFKMVPATGVLQPNKLVTTKLTFFSKKLVEFKNVPILNCIFIDALHKTVIETFPLMAFGKTFLSGFELCPPEQINFGYQLVGTEKVQQMTLTNNGRFDFNYSIVNLRKLLEMKDKKGKDKKDESRGKGSKGKDSKSSKSKSKESKVSKKSEKGKDSKSSRKSDKSEKKKPKPTKLDVGMFSVISSTGIVEPNETCTIQVFSRPKQATTFEETIVFFVSECAVAEKNGRFISLSVTGCAPSINFEDYDGIFREQYIVNRITEFECPKEVGAHCVFIKEESRLHFSRVFINKEATARIRLENNGPIPTDVIAKITSVPENIFSVNPDRFNVDTYSANYTTISFVPNAIDTLYGTLEIRYECPANLTSSKLQIKLSGEGFVPEVALRQPAFDDGAGCFAINFKPTFIGRISHHTISFENIGIISCQVIIEVCEGTLDVFTLVPHNDTLPLLKIWEEVIQATAHTNLVNLHPGQVGKFELHFKPTKGGQFKCLVKLHIVNNPFETFMIFVTAEAYLADLTIEGLPTITIKKAKSSEEFPFTTPGYELDFGCSFINTLQKKCFKITNHSPETTYKFEIALCDKFLFIPAVGHLKPKASKDIIVTFLSKEPVNIFKEPLKCTIYGIEYVNPQLEPLSWDERQNFVIWEPLASAFPGSPGSSGDISPTINVSRASFFSKRSNGSSPWNGYELEIPLPSSTEAAIKTIQEKFEPANEIIPGTLQYVPLLVTVECDYSSYQCSEQEIKMLDTLAFEKRSYTFEVTNTSNVFLNLRWKIALDEGYPRRINSAVCDSNLSFAKKESYHSNRVIQSASQMSTVLYSSIEKNQRPMHLTGTEKFLPDESTPYSSTKSSLFSSEANLSSRSNDSWIEGDFLPFSITPNFASIQPKESKTFKVTFTPKDVFNYLVHLQSEISNLNPSLKCLDVTVKARSLLPLCHFDIGPSDYLDVRRKGGKFCRDIADENTRVVEFEAIGLGISCTRTFNILNPTGESFCYQWLPSEINGKDVSLFHCHGPEGYVEKGKMAEAIFSFLPQTTGTFEAFYIFHIQKYNLNRTFLLVGIAREPSIYFSHPHLQIRPTVIGIDITESITLKNNENFEADFRFKKESLYSEARLQALIVEPMKGILRPCSEQQIKITFHPVKRGEVNFNLKCIVEKMKKPLLLSVTANCFEIQPVVFYESNDGDKIILDAEKINMLDLKTMSPHVKQETNFIISNIGATGFYYSWSIKEDLISNRVKITFNDKDGYIKSKSEISSVMSVTPLTKVVLKKLRIKLEIRYGPTYLIHLMGTAAQSLFAFSIDEYDFGPCLIQKEDTSYYKKIIEFANNDEIPIMLECKMPDQDHLSLNFKSKLIEPKTSVQFLVTFHPREIKHYYTEIEFYVNSKLHMLKFRGEGVVHSMQLWDPHDKFIDLGCIPMGKTSTKVVKVVNNSTTPVDIIFDLYDRLPYFSRPQKVLNPEFEIEEPPKTIAIAKDKKDKKEQEEKKESKKEKKSEDSKKGEKDSKKDSKKDKTASKESKKETKGKKEKIIPPEEVPAETPEQIQQRLIREFITFSPKKFTTVSPQRSTEFSIKFSPTERMKTFTEKVSYQIQDNIETLCIFKACSLGSEYELEKNSVAFGTVIHGCFSKQKVVLYNKGEIGGAFKWAFEKPQINFIITPKEGYISPGTCIAFSIKFKPTHVSCLLQAKANCTIEGFKKPLELTLTGSCFNMPPPKALIKFLCPVRESDTKSIAIQNPTGQIWRIPPTINGPYFTTPDVLTVNPNCTESCDITYKPLTMSKENPHEASIFFHLPEGQGLLYSLMGTTQNPLPVDTITREITCKTYHSEILNVKNWLKTPQKFTVITESTVPSTPANKTLYKLTGNDAIDVPAQSQRDYTWTIYVLNEGLLKFKVLFKNMATSEYLLYEIALTVTKCPPLDVIKLTTCIRVPIMHTIKLQNPIKTPVVYTIQSTSAELSFDNPITVPPYSEYSLMINYNPLLLGQTEAHLDILTKELGNYPYDIILTAHPPVPEPYICFTAALGQTVSQKAILFNTAKSIENFMCEIQHPDVFYLNQAVSVAPQQKGEFDVYFEPDSIGNIQSTLTLTSPATGPYIYPLIGTCTLPKPQGPYFIKPGASTTIIFKNPFNESVSFSFAVEPAIFSLKSTLEDVKARKDVKVVVNLLPLKNLEILIDQKYPITGKLLAYSTESHLSYIKWIYYLQGDLSN